MRLLLYFSGRMAESRGTPTRVRQFARHLAARDDLELLCLTGDAPGDLGPLADAHRRVPRPSEGPAVLARAVADFRPDRIWGHTHKALPVLAGLELADGCRRVADLHGDMAGERLEQSWRPRWRRLAGYLRQRLAERRPLARMDGFTVVTRLVASRLPRGAAVHLLWGGVDLQRFRPRDLTPAPALRVLYAGNFRPYQGVPVLLEAAGRLLASDPAGYQFTLIGDPTGSEAALETARQALAGRLTVLGPVPYEEMPGRLAAADVLVVPRPDSRSARAGFPSKLPEYLATGRAVVATDVGEQGRVITDGQTGLLIEPGSVDALVAALARLRDPGLRRRLGAAGRRFAEENLGWPTLTAGFCRFLEELA